ncbi:MAG: hypothetical protein WED34_03090 [Planctomycetales bacterium]
MSAGAKGAIISIFAAFPWAALVALVYGFPVPFADGKPSGFAAVVPSLFAVLFYGLIGGFVVLGVAGAAAGFAASWLGRRDGDRARVLCWVFAGAASGGCVVFLAVLDRFIGPW